LGAQQGDVGGTVTAQRHRDGQIQQDLRGVMDRAGPSPEPHVGAQVTVQA
jgi:hypothetical protein